MSLLLKAFLLGSGEHDCTTLFLENPHEDPRGHEREEEEEGEGQTSSVAVEVADLFLFQCGFLLCRTCSCCFSV